MLYQAPGRINIIGEHLDYNGGSVIPAGLDLYTWVAAEGQNDRVLQLHFMHQELDITVDLDAVPAMQATGPESYIHAMIRALTEAGYELKGGNVVIGGNLPLGAGMSSSASLETVLGLALIDLCGDTVDGSTLARLCHRAESEFVGVQCGVMDQLAISLAEVRRAILINCTTQQHQQLPFPGRSTFVLAHCGRSRQLADGSLNRRHDGCMTALGLLQQAIPNLRNLAELGVDQLLHHRDLLSEEHFRICRHVVSEVQRVSLACDALKDGEDEDLGRLLNESHTSLRDDYRVSCKELDHTVKLMRQCKGTLGARMMGAGFGGCAIALVRNEMLSDMVVDLRTGLSTAIGSAAWVHTVGSAEPVGRIEYCSETFASRLVS